MDTKVKISDGSTSKPGHPKTDDENLFIKFLDQLFWTGYGVQFLSENSDAFYAQLTRFITLRERSSK